MWWPMGSAAGTGNDFTRFFSLVCHYGMSVLGRWGEW